MRRLPLRTGNNNIRRDSTPSTVQSTHPVTVSVISIENRESATPTK